MRSFCYYHLYILVKQLKVSLLFTPHAINLKYYFLNPYIVTTQLDSPPPIRIIVAQVHKNAITIEECSL